MDRLIRTFDIRAPTQGPLVIIPGHDYAVRKIAWSPHDGHMLLSASYDMTCRVWTDGPSSAEEEEGGEKAGAGSGLTNAASGEWRGGKQVGMMDAHTEFAMGVDWCMFGQPGWCVTCGWDERVLVWDVHASMNNGR